MVQLATVLAGIAWDPHIRGALAVFVGVVVLCGSIYMILGTNLGGRLGLLVALAGLAGWMVILTLIWWMVPPGIGPKGPSPSWHAVEIFVEGPDEPIIEAVRDLPASGEFPDPEVILAENPDVAAEFENTPVLSDLEATHPDVVDQYLVDVDLGGWKLVTTSDAGEAQAAADVALVDSGFFSGPTDYKKLDTFETGGKGTLQDTCPDAEAESGSFLPDEPLCRIWYKLKTIVQVKNPPAYAVVQVQQVVPQEPREGEAPPLPKVDPDAPVVSVVLVRDLGNERMIPFLYFVISLSLFVFFVLVLHYRDKTLQKNLEAAKAAKGA